MEELNKTQLGLQFKNKRALVLLGVEISSFIYFLLSEYLFEYTYNEHILLSNGKSSINLFLLKNKDNVCCLEYLLRWLRALVLKMACKSYQSSMN